MMNTNVDALKNLYEQLGGDPADVANCSTSVEVLNAIAAKYGGADDAIINPDAINNIAAVASSIGGASADLAALIDRSITSVVIPESVTSIGAGAFSNCSSLTSIVIHESVTSIGANAFSNCSSLTSIVIPESVTSIGQTAFNNCTSLTSVVIPEGVTSIGATTFGGCSSLTSVVIPESVTSIGVSAFSNCSSLTSVVIPESVTSIGQYAFRAVTGTLYCKFSEGAVSGAPWGAAGTIVYDYNE